MATANDIRRGMAINYNGDIAVVLDTQHRTPGNLRAFVQASIRSIRTGKSSDVRFSSTEKIEVVPMMTRKMEFSYKDGEDFVFSDPESYETVTVTPEIVGDGKFIGGSLDQQVALLDSAGSLPQNGGPGEHPGAGDGTTGSGKVAVLPADRICSGTTAAPQ